MWGFTRGYLVFVEVKYRRTHSMGGALEAVTLKKQQKICRTADFYRCSQGIGDLRQCAMMWSPYRERKSAG